MSKKITRLVIVGGGTAGWLSAGVIAAEHGISPQSDQQDNAFQLTLVESPDIKTIGVGEGTWPSMRTTLKKMGLSETDFIRECTASFKQGTEFAGWTTGEDDNYTHPFTVPQGYSETNLAPHWQAVQDRPRFDQAVSPQSVLFAEARAPKQISTPEYACAVNYGYHLDAAKFAEFLRKHCVENLGVKHIKANVTAVNSAENGDIASISTDSGGDIAGDLFIDCSGSRALLLGEYYQVPLRSKKQFLFNDTALAVQVPYANPEDPIASCTLSTAQTAGWIWDIGLPTRRGTGHVYSSAHNTEDKATAELLSYIERTAGKQAAADAEPRKINFDPGHRAEFWHKNCVAVGMSAGFIEPLEASALILVELSSNMIAEQLPANREMMDIVAKRFNDKFLYRWDRIIDFLKLHYILNKRQDRYWRDHLDPASIPESLQELIALWKYQGPWHRDTNHIDEMFPSASFQYVLYGMNFETQPSTTARRSDRLGREAAAELFQKNAKQRQQLQAAMPTNRELINKINTYGLQKI
jgi:flavin-dependent dehydrogenase